MSELKCTKILRINDGKDMQGRPLFHHEKCGKDAAEYEVGGLLTKAKAILCATHKAQADKENFISSRGYKLGKIDEKCAKEDRIDHQDRLPGTGVNGD